NALAEGGYAVEEMNLPHVERATEIYYQLLGDLTAPSDPAVVSETFVRYREAFASAYAAVSGEPAADAWSDRLIFAREWSELMERTPLILAPVATMPPWPVGYDESGTDQAIAWLRAIRMVVLVNLFGLPAAS